MKPDYNSNTIEERFKNQIFLWRAILSDDTQLSEIYDGFDDIDKSRLKYFILEDKEDTTRFTHNINTGVMSFQGNDIRFYLNNHQLGLTNDIINYKEVLMQVPPTINSTYIGYYTGWKEKNEEFDYIEILFWVDMMEERIKLRVRLVAKDERYLDNLLKIVVGDPENGDTAIVNLKLDKEKTKTEFAIYLFGGGEDIEEIKE